MLLAGINLGISGCSHLGVKEFNCYTEEAKTVRSRRHGCADSSEDV